MAKGLASIMEMAKEVEDDDDDIAGLLEFDAPEGFEIPETAEPGSNFDATVSLLVTPEGRLRLASINGINLAEEVEGEEDLDTPVAPKTLEEATAQQKAGIMYA